VVTAFQHKVPLYTTKGAEIRAAQRLGIFLLIAGAATASTIAWAQDSLAVATPAPAEQEPAGMNGIMVLLISQAVSRLVGWIWGKLRDKD